MDEKLMTDEHEAIEMLLPWYVTGQVDADEVAQVDAHLAHCGACRALLAEEHRLKSQFAAMPVAAPMFAMPALPNSNRRSIVRRSWQATRRTVSGWAARPMRVAAFATAQAAMLLIAFQLGQPTARPNAEYRTLSASDAATEANAIVMFKPETREAEFRSLLTDADAEIVGGPTESNGYLLNLPQEKRDAALETFRRQPQIMLAEPIDGE
jgi:anti-sigma factor RsiW